jgi:D-aminoacyl-tRNA deacylase
MRALIQRVRNARVQVQEETVGSIGPGLLIFLGISPQDTQREVAYLASKIAKLRIFPDDQGLMNLSIPQMAGEILVVSQFTLYGDCQKGNRPSFTAAARPEHAEPLYEEFVRAVGRESGRPTATGRFGADMLVELTNWGPVTLWLETDPSGGLKPTP